MIRWLARYIAAGMGKGGRTARAETAPSFPQVLEQQSLWKTSRRLTSIGLSPNFSARPEQKHAIRGRLFLRVPLTVRW
jgi:hypothetical protein